MKSPGRKPPGIMVLDACEFFTMSARTEGALAEEPLNVATPRGAFIGCYLDLLTQLATHGWQVILPEMVAFECNQINSNGHDIVRLFQGDDDKRGGNWEGRKEFISRISRGRYPGITMARADREQAEGYGLYMRQVDEIFDLAMTRALPDNLRDQAMRRAIVDLNKSTNKHHTGEMHCHDVIRENILAQRAAGTQIPLYFVSADSDARHDLREQCSRYRVEGDAPVRVLTLAGILNGLEKSTATHSGAQTNALQELGMHPSAEFHWEHVSRQRTALPPLRDCGKYNYFDAAVESYNPPRPFEQASATLAQAMCDARTTLALAAKPNPASDRIARFKAQMEARDRKNNIAPGGR